MEPDDRQLNPTPATWADVLAAVLIFTLFVAAGVAMVRQYGLTWDEPENLVVGERYLAFFRTGDVTLLDFGRPRPEVDNPDGLHLRLLDSHAHPPLPNIAAAFTGRLFGRWTGWLDPVDARHVAIIGMGGLTLAVVYLFAREAFGRSVAVLAVVALALFPRFVGDTHYNLKDIPKTLFFALTLWTLWHGVVFRRARWVVVAGLVLGMGLSVRPNVALAAVAGALWALLRVRFWWPQRRVRLALFAVPLIATVGFFCAWPAMWIAPVVTVRRIWEYWVWLGLTGRKGWTPYPVLALAFTTPLPTLLLACWGAVGGLRLGRGDAHRSLVLLGLWLALPLVRVSMPGMNVYDGIRHFLEAVPALAILAGLGVGEVVWLVTGVFRRLPSRIVQAAAALLFIPALIDLLRFSPYEIAYFNRLIGGLPGAQAAGIRDAADYWGTSYRHGFAWLGEHAPSGALLYMPPGQRHLAEAVRGLWLRADIRLVAEGDPADGPVYVLYTRRPTEYGVVDRYCRAHLQPVYAIAVDGGVILELFALSPEEWREIPSS